MRGYSTIPKRPRKPLLGPGCTPETLRIATMTGSSSSRRKKEMIIRVYNVYPREVEEVLYSHPAVNEVAVVGVPDERLGDEVKAFVSLRKGQPVTEQELINYVKGKVAAYKYPRDDRNHPRLDQGAHGQDPQEGAHVDLRAVASQPERLR